MSFRVNCDRCDAFIKAVAGNELRDMLASKQPVVCKKCKEVEVGLENFIKQQRAAVAKKLEAEYSKALRTLQEEISELSKSRFGAERETDKPSVGGSDRDHE